MRMEWVFSLVNFFAIFWCGLVLKNAEMEVTISFIIFFVALLLLGRGSSVPCATKPNPWTRQSRGSRFRSASSSAVRGRGNGPTNFFVWPLSARKRQVAPRFEDRSESITNVVDETAACDFAYANWCIDNLHKYSSNIGSLETCYHEFMGSIRMY